MVSVELSPTPALLKPALPHSPGDKLFRTEIRVLVNFKVDGHHRIEITRPGEDAAAVGSLLVSDDDGRTF